MENTVIDQRFTLLSPLGTGGEARVFRARDEVTQEETALRLGMQPDRLASSVEPPANLHRGWVRLLHAGTDAMHGAYQVFEFLSGQTLGEIVNGVALDENTLENFMRESLDATEALHDAGYIHGDLNADNFFHSAAGWKILELPFARFQPPPGRSHAFGNIHTLAPEQIDGAAPSVATDLYALGCLYYYAASGAWPHPGATYAEVAIHTLRFAPEPLTELSAGRGAGIMQMLATRRTDRPDSAAAARRLLEVA